MTYKKYYLYKKQVSYDGGVTYQDVVPLVTAPSGDPIASYSTLEECEGITSCTCADFTYSPTAFTVSSAATSVTFNYSGCTEPIFNRITPRWCFVDSTTYDTGATTGSVIVNISANTSSARTTSLAPKVNDVICQELGINQESGIAPTACTCDAFAFEGTSEGNNTYRIEIPSGETAVTAASWNTDCGVVPQDFTHTDDSGFQEIVTDGHWAFDNNIIRFTASTNPTSSVREGNMTITYTVDGNNCTKVTHLVQAAGTGSTAGGVKISIHVPTGQTSPRIAFLNNGGTVLGSVTRSGEGVINMQWTTNGTCTQMSFLENGGNMTGVTMNIYAGTTVINNQPLSPGSTETIIQLTQSFNTSDYNDGNRTISLTFTK